MFPQIPNSWAKVGCLSSQLPFVCSTRCTEFTAEDSVPTCVLETSYAGEDQLCASFLPGREALSLAEGAGIM